MKIAESYPHGQKTLWEKEKLHVTSNFSFYQCFQKVCFPGASKGVIVWNVLKNQAEISVVLSCILALSPITTNRLLGGITYMGNQ